MMMMTIRRSDDRGHADYGWLNANYTFSFGQYRDRAFMGFGPLRVLNQDRVAPGKGFDTHGHDNMEIVTYILDGVLEHRDSMGNGSQMRPGEVQLMSAGTGVTHSEFNASDNDPLHLLQMWIIPEARDTEPRYEQREFAESERRGVLRLVVSPDGVDGSLTIGQDAKLFASILGDDDEVSYAIEPNRAAWLHTARGRLQVNGEELGPGDGAAITDETPITLRGVEDAEIVLWDLPAAPR